MSIVTKKGDRGMTTLMYNRQVPKTDARVEAYGAVDELNSALGLARATAEISFIRESLLGLQEDLVIVMGELAVLPEDRPRYTADGYSLVTSAMTAKLDHLVAQIEAQIRPVKGWAMPGGSLHCAALDNARTVARRAERRLCGLRESNQLPNAELLIYLNRLSDLLWLMARRAEQPPALDKPELA